MDLPAALAEQDKHGWSSQPDHLPNQTNKDYQMADLQQGLSNGRFNAMNVLNGPFLV